MHSKFASKHTARHSRGRSILSVLGSLGLVLALMFPFAPPAKAETSATKPTIVLVHGAFAESLSWEDVIGRLLAKDYPVVAAPNPLRGVHSDATYIGSILDGIKGPIVLVGHSYGGNVITNAATGRKNIKGLVYVAGFAPDLGESAGNLAGKFPGSTLEPTLTSVPLPGGGKDLYIRQSEYHKQFAADLPPRVAALLAATQRPITEAALNEPSGAPAWKSIPSWFIYGTADKNIPPALQPFMARRAQAKRTVVVEGASHVVMASHPDDVAKLIIEAATSP